MIINAFCKNAASLLSASHCSALVSDDNSSVEKGEQLCFLRLTCKNRLPVPYNLYCVCGDVKHCSIQSSRLYRIETLYRANPFLQGVVAANT